MNFTLRHHRFYHFMNKITCSMHQMEMLDRFCIPQNQSETAASCREFTLMHLASRPDLLIPFQSLLPGRLPFGEHIPWINTRLMQEADKWIEHLPF